MLRKLYYFYNSSATVLSSIGLDKFKFTAFVITVLARLSQMLAMAFLRLKDRLLKYLQLQNYVISPSNSRIGFDLHTVPL